MYGQLVSSGKAEIHRNASFYLWNPKSYIYSPGEDSAYKFVGRPI